MHIIRALNSTSNSIRVTLRNRTTGQGLTGLTSASSGGIISTICDNEATATTYTVAASNLETITTLGTWAAPTSGKCRFKEVDATNHPGLYEIQLADARFAVSSSKTLRITISGFSDILTRDVVIQLTRMDVDDVVRHGMTALPNVASGDSGALPTTGTGSNQINVSGGRVDSNVLYWNSSAVSVPTTAGVPNVNVKTWNDLPTVALPLAPTTAGRTLDVSAGGEAGIDWSNVGSPTTTVAFTGTTIGTITTYTGNTVQTGDTFARVGAAGAGLTAIGDTRLANLDALVSSRSTYAGGAVASVTAAVTVDTINSNAITAASIAAAAFAGKGDWLLASSYTAPTNLTAAQIASGVWQDTTAGDFTVALSIGKSIMNGVALGTGLTINGYTGNTPQSGDAFARIGANGTGLTSLGDTRLANLDTTVSSRSTFAGGAVASVTAAVTLPAIPADWITASGIAASAGAEIADAVWDEPTGGHLTAGTTGAAIVAAGSAGDPWSTTLPGAYGAGTAGFLIGTYVDAAISSRSSYAGGDTAGTSTLLSRIPSALTITSGKVDVNDKTGFVLAAGGLANISTWTVTITGNLLGTVNSVVDAPWTLLG